ncbi:MULTISPECIES: pyridoxal phosphate-dependent aminotransferase [unclassified Chelatococcus]|uniref:pyridoxal phosphate-dependent aminotransferase n=1 Tax=unclassified Chelatococcus TaxID=2638111 RepID=UPI0002FC5322|nr:MULTISPECIES: aminotransferase class I/II-fold pyridoxal phosphate-dependent enzyme [unclassified Chelatococcus]ALA18850.1 1-aminocyclopropane-1-carboxylate deaminase [Chelatococcus sp. CO-6]
MPLPSLPARLSRVSSFLAMDVLAAARTKERAGGDVVHMEVGQPSAPAPRRVQEAARAALDIGQIGYTEALGLPSLRERIARHYRDAYGVDVAPERVVATTGSSAGFVLAFLALFEPGARVAITAPGYPAYRNIFAALGIEPVDIAVDAASGWVMTAEAVERAHREAPLAGVLVMSPANPSGTMMGREALARLADTCRRSGIWFISDEIYHGLTYDAPAETALAVHDDALIVNSFSKYYCMTGWRIGWLVVPHALVRPVETLAQNLYISPPYLSQVAAEAAFDAVEELEAIKAGYAANRAFLLEKLAAIGLGEGPPVDGAFYIYRDVARFTNDSLAFCRRMLEETGVAATPGLDFDPDRGARFVRFSFAGSMEDCRQTVARLRAWLR